MVIIDPVSPEENGVLCFYTKAPITVFRNREAEEGSVTMEISQETASKQKLGYVVVRQGEEGYIGGYLCADERGVPIEFWHTTGSPVRADRFQVLLYGKTLKPELLGRNITGSLLGDEQGNHPANLTRGGWR
jgi:hypothetical protein